MSVFARSISRTIAPLAMEAAVFPERHIHSCREWGCQPFTRQQVVDRYGERAAMAWDDLQAAARSFERAIQPKEGQSDG